MMSMKNMQTKMGSNCLRQGLQQKNSFFVISVQIIPFNRQGVPASLSYKTDCWFIYLKLDGHSTKACTYYCCTETLFDKFTSKECKSKPYVASIMSQA